MYVVVLNDGRILLFVVVPLSHAAGCTHLAFKHMSL